MLRTHTSSLMTRRSVRKGQAYEIRKENTYLTPISSLVPKKDHLMSLSAPKEVVCQT